MGGGLLGTIAGRSRRLLGASPARGHVAVIRAHRANLARRLLVEFDRTVRYGPFAGMRLLDSSAWSPGDKAPMLLGLYERELLSEIVAAPPRYDRFVDVGAADGYYAVGLLVADRFAHVTAYEMSEAGRISIRMAGELNGVADRLEIRGAAEVGFHDAISPEDRDRSVFLVDIEGAEFDVLTEEAFRALSRSMLFVETHPWEDPGGSRLAALGRAAAGTHDVAVIVHSGRDIYQFAELSHLHEDDLWLLCSEGRPCAMSWLKFTPRE